MTAEQRPPPPEVADDELLWRFIKHPDWLVRDDAGNPIRVSSVAFKDRTDESRAVSVFRPKLIDDESRGGIIGSTTEAAEILCSIARELGHKVTPDATDGQHYSHALVIPPTTDGKAWAKNAGKLAERARFLTVTATTTGTA